MCSSPGVEPGPCGWEQQFLTARPTQTVHSSILNSDALVGRLFCYIPVDFQLIKGLAGLQTFSQSGSRTRDLRVRSANPNLSHQQTLLPFKMFPSPGVEPGPFGWKPQILTARPTGSVYVSIPNSYAFWSFVLLPWIDFKIIDDLCWIADSFTVPESNSGLVDESQKS